MIVVICHDCQPCWAIYREAQGPARAFSCVYVYVCIVLFVVLCVLCIVMCVYIALSVCVCALCCVCVFLKPAYPVQPFIAGFHRTGQVGGTSLGQEGPLRQWHLQWWWMLSFFFFFFFFFFFVSRNHRGTLQEVGKYSWRWHIYDSGEKMITAFKFIACTRWVWNTIFRV